MYQAKVFSRQDGSEIMQSEIYQEENASEMIELVRSFGSGEGYYTVIYKLETVWSNLKHPSPFPPLL